MSNRQPLFLPKNAQKNKIKIFVQLAQRGLIFAANKYIIFLFFKW